MESKKHASIYTINQRPAGWHFDNSYGRLDEVFYSKVHPTPVRLPKLVKLNHSLAADLGLDADTLQHEDNVAVFAGNAIPKGALPLAQAYAGHQFGHFTMLGDGRAVLIGEQMTPDGARYDIQLKGSGETPYSRRGDGRATLGPMLREYMISEAMHALGIPTTRSLAVATTGEPVYRETELPGAVLTRVAASHIRVGTFQYAAHWGTTENLRELADYTLQRHFTDIELGDNRYRRLLEEVIGRQASLIAQWMLVGFIHGVMNTDNMTLSGDTIDYGPCAFMDAYDPATVFSSIDRQGRYAYGNQPQIALWNLARFAETLLPLLHKDEEEAIKIAEEALNDFPVQYRRHWLSGMRGKLGLPDEAPEDEALIEDLLEMMQNHHADYTNTFLALTYGKPEDTAMHGSKAFTEWYETWEERIGRQPEAKQAAQALMRSSNPAVIPRNFLVEEALEAAVENADYRAMDRLLTLLANPYTHTPEQAECAREPVPANENYRTFCGT